jgi:HAD superfamily hydrolase (TIGR01509 family)
MTSGRILAWPRGVRACTPGRVTTRPATAVTFDFGQTLCAIDTAMLSRRLAERGLDVAEAHLDAALPAALAAYDAGIHRGLGGHPWKVLMSELLARAEAPSIHLEATVDWLWTEQPTKNLWRRPIAGMIEIVDALRARAIPVGILSNSEGRLAELVSEIGWGDRFDVIADSGALGLEKPGTAIFAWTADALRVPMGNIVHIGDSFAADVEGAVNAGLRAIWFAAKPGVMLPARAQAATSAMEVRSALAAMGFALDGSARVR